MQVVEVCYHILVLSFVFITSCSLLNGYILFWLLMIARVPKYSVFARKIWMDISEDENKESIIKKHIET